MCSFVNLKFDFFFASHKQNPTVRCQPWEFPLHSKISHNAMGIPIMKKQVSECVIKFNSLSWDSGQRGPYILYKQCYHSLYIGVTNFPHIYEIQ